MNVHDRFAALWTDYLEGEIEESGMAELRELLAANDELVQQATDMFQTHRLLGLISVDSPRRHDEFVRNTLALLPADDNAFVSSVMSQVEATRSEKAVEASRSDSKWWQVAFAIAASLLLAFFVHANWPEKQITTAAVDVPESAVRLASSSHAKFFGELAPPVGATLVLQREYVLMSGLIEVGFPQGALAIVEGPAVFRVSSDESLALDVGRCSVHAPPGAEGFRIDTPTTRIVDRGTRFAVNVAESSETDVQVIEGAADVYNAAPPKNQQKNSETRLTNGEAKRFASSGQFAAGAIPFDASLYRRQLPDRVASYTASKGPDGGAENLVSVTVQRGGQMFEIPVDELIPARVSWFNATAAGSFFCGGSTLPESRVTLSSDRSLVSGVINPDGSRNPLTSSPVMHGEQATPGMAIGFERAVVNGPGPDVVLFDLQTFANPPDGDAFHVSPLSFRSGLKTHTIRRYDLTMESPEALDLTDFHVYQLTEKASSLAELESLPTTSHKQVIKFRGLAVGIDLSDLGFAAGESVKGLFIQDALDDQHHVDPVFIGGLPELK